MTPEKLKELGLDVFKEKVFFSTMIREEDMHLLSAIFMPVTFLDEAQVKQLDSDEVVAFYEYMDKAGPRSLNGYPMFMSMKTITKRDLKELQKIVQNLKDAAEKATGGVD